MMWCDRCGAPGPTASLILDGEDFRRARVCERCAEAIWSTLGPRTWEEMAPTEIIDDIGCPTYTDTQTMLDDPDAKWNGERMI